MAKLQINAMQQAWLKVPYIKALSLVLAFGVLVAVKVLSYAQTTTSLDEVFNLERQIPFYTRCLRLKWQHYKELELSTRAIVNFEGFGAQLAQLMFEKADNLEWLTSKAPLMPFAEKVVEPLNEYKRMNVEFTADNRQAVADPSKCALWEFPDCSVLVPGVASNTDVSIAASEGQAACDALDNGLGICEWMPSRPDEVPEPQPPNLLNKCVCYACKGKLPTASYRSSLPANFQTTKRGTDAKYQCENDPEYIKNDCKWDGGNCVPRKPSSTPSILNSTEYMQRFDTMLAHVRQTSEDTEKSFISRLDALEIALSRSYYAVLICLVAACLLAAGEAGYLAFSRKNLRWRLYAYQLLSLATSCLLCGIAMRLLSDTRAEMLDLIQVQIPMLTNTWAVLFQDVVLTTSASRFVMSAHNSGWVDEDYTGVPGGVRVYDAWFITYIENVGALDEAIAKAKEMSQTEEDVRIFSNIDVVNKLLVDLETIALTSVEPPDASALPANDTTMGVTTMYGDSYLRAKLIYNAENERFLAAQAVKLTIKLNQIRAGGQVNVILSTIVDITACFLAGTLLLLRKMELDSSSSTGIQEVTQDVP